MDYRSDADAGAGKRGSSVPGRSKSEQLSSRRRNRGQRAAGSHSAERCVRAGPVGDTVAHSDTVAEPDTDANPIADADANTSASIVYGDAAARVDFDAGERRLEHACRSGKPRLSVDA